MNAFLQRLNRDWNRRLHGSASVAVSHHGRLLGTITKDDSGVISLKHRDGSVSHGYGSDAKALMDMLMDSVR